MTENKSWPQRNKITIGRYYLVRSWGSGEMEGDHITLPGIKGLGRLNLIQIQHLFQNKSQQAGKPRSWSVSFTNIDNNRTKTVLGPSILDSVLVPEADLHRVMSLNQEERKNYWLARLNTKRRNHVMGVVTEPVVTQAPAPVVSTHDLATTNALLLQLIQSINNLVATRELKPSYANGAATVSINDLA